jgi:hypothetical protein
MPFNATIARAMTAGTANLAAIIRAAYSLEATPATG